MAASTSSSLTATPPASRGWFTAKVSSPGIFDSSASQSWDPPGGLPSRTPLLSERTVSSAPSGSTA